eukprot:CAMPEP_0201582318 /NCGR_PEP_ID=MMETSP0190_2-20130828/83445_1 /ASSEMBLY_ACC=CAM_ASM_000263 /TAXON_ID=37353 /ORGANISM="Rosalina sp." /LENGTH=101 /DNA_ID=CAMNT_0048022001 /DNA_START=188 /DNA_END=493 /DNA_ORIENTATION=-
MMEIINPNPVNIVAAINNGLFTSSPEYVANSAVGEGVGGDVVGLSVGTGDNVGDLVVVVVGLGILVVMGTLVLLLHAPLRYVLYDRSGTCEQADVEQQHNE